LEKCPFVGENLAISLDPMHHRDMTTTMTLAHPTLRTYALYAHGILTAWLLVNGVGHQLHVLYKAHAGTLKPGANVDSLLAVGAGLIIAGGIMSFTMTPLMRAVSPTVLPAFGSIGLIALVLAGTAYVYGFSFLGGSIALTVIDTCLLIAHAMLNNRS
jgi:hypothetical protein